MPFELDPTVILDTSLITLHSQHPIGSEHAVPGVNPDELSTYKIPADGLITLREAPKQLSASIPTGVVVVTVGAGTPFIEVFVSPAAGQFLVNYVNGIITFNISDAGTDIVASFTSIGSIIHARDINNNSTKLFGDQGSGESFFSKLDPITTDGVDFTITGTLTVNNLNISAGVINKTATEVLDLTDNILLLNSGLVDDGAPTTIVGLEIARSANPAGDPTHPQFVWNETDDSWDIKSTNITFAAGTELLKIRDAGGLKLQTIDSTTSPTEATFTSGLTVSEAGTIWFNNVTFQFMGWNGTAAVVLG